MRKGVVAFLPVLVFSCAISVPVLIDEDYVIPDDYPVNTVADATAARYQALLDEATRNGVPGFSVLIDGPEGFWASAGGLADIPNRIEAKRYSLFKIGSVTKTYTAAIILSMEAEGLLDIDDPIADYLPADVVSRITCGDEITILQLLNHRSGIPNYFGFSLYGLPFAADALNYFPDFVLSAEEMLEYIYGKPADFEPGTDWNYSNTNYTILGLIAEGIDGKSYGQILQERVCEPLGLQSTFYHEPGALPKGMARGYDALYGDNRLYDVTDDASGLGGDGGIIANTYDVARFFRALFNEELFGSEQLDEMLTHHPPFLETATAPVRRAGYALGLFYESVDEIPTYYCHYGYVYGYGADAYYFPQRDTMLVYLSNTTNNPIAGANGKGLRDLLWSFLDEE